MHASTLSVSNGAVCGCKAQSLGKVKEVVGPCQNEWGKEGEKKRCICLKIVNLHMWSNFWGWDEDLQKGIYVVEGT